MSCRMYSRIPVLASLLLQYLIKTLLMPYFALLDAMVAATSSAFEPAAAMATRYH